ncbi:MAG: hypothetical protein COU85_02405 [Candidatus Portnoybacteria bacterium CG10_big_fil_rev_8_21_14_0_10_44_7]|uniref:Uncharacterized protein n=1 Tax=Candidatus Portnoybacteria bacterium CG10_big_fil_rev_8_21_14_0_10_44_7 TaxID=1974816 RepID=A0A2M8KIC2_9BACT|nr:MAG: hypothetical protein COU85_02405 [Candidatus Portnoybacteria bacterium CG10_big_fil_rev_8_21_14_0_10_44_7]
MKFLSWKLIVFVYIPALIAGGLVLRAVFSPPAAPYQTAQAQIKDLVYEVEVTGTVKKAEEFELQFKNSGKISRVNVKVGDQVKSGQLLVEQENNDLVSQIIEAQASLKVTQAQLAQAQDPYSPQEIQVAQTKYANSVQNLADVRSKAEVDLQHDLDSALDALGQAESKIDKALLGTVKDMNYTYFQKLDAVGSQLQNLENEARTAYLGNASFSVPGAVGYLDQAQNDSIESKILTALDAMHAAADKTRVALVQLRESMNDGAYGATSTDKTTVDTEVAAINTQIDNITGAKQAITLQKITNASNINTAQATVNNNLDDLNLKLAGAHQPDIFVAQARVAQANASLTALQNKFKDTRISAPVAGIITRVEIKKGETASAGQVIVKMNGISENEIETQISEVDIAFIKIGDPVKITLDAFPYSQAWDGRVVKIDPAQTVISDVVYYKATTDFSLHDEQVKPGMTANLTITTNKKEGALAIPQRAVIEKNQQNFVRVPNPQGGFIEKEVFLGMRSSDGDAEVISGLQAGETVITFINNGS